MPADRIRLSSSKRAAAVVLAVLCVEILVALGLYVHRTVLLRRARDARNRSALLRFRLERNREEAVIRRRVEAIRKLAFRRRVPSRIMKREDIRAFVLRKLEETFTEDELEGYELALELFGAIPEGRDLGEILSSFYASQAGGFYDYHTRTLYRVAGGPLRKAVLAHEYTHALQDQHFGMADLPLENRDNDDLALTALCIVEGDAMIVTSDYLFKHSDLETFLGTPASMANVSATESLRKAPHYIREVTLFPYMKGTVFVELVRDKGGWEAVNRLFADLPASSEQIIHPHKYLGAQRDDPRTVKVKTGTARIERAFPGSWRCVRGNVMGEHSIYALLSIHLPRRSAEIGSRGWDGDRYEVYVSGERAVLSWSTLWDGARDAKEFFTLMSSALDAELGPGGNEEESSNDATWVRDGRSAALERSGDRVHLLKTRDGATLRALLREEDT